MSQTVSSPAPAGATLSRGPRTAAADALSRGPRAAAASAEARAVTLLAATLHAETAGRPVRAVEAMAALVLNRARRAATDPAARLRFTPRAPAGRPLGLPSLIAAACRAPFAFACWRDPAGRAAMAMAATAEDARFAACRRIALRAMAGNLPDPTGGATHWHPAETVPPWARGLTPVAEIGGLVFYRTP